MAKATRGDGLRYALLGNASTTFAVHQVDRIEPALLDDGHNFRGPREIVRWLEWLESVAAQAQEAATAPEAPVNFDPAGKWVGPQDEANLLSAAWKRAEAGLRRETAVALEMMSACIFRPPSKEDSVHAWGDLNPTFLLVPLHRPVVTYLGPSAAIVAGPYEESSCVQLREWLLTAKNRERLG